MCYYLDKAELMCSMGNLKMMDLQLLEAQSFGDPVYMFSISWILLKSFECCMQSWQSFNS